MSIDAIKCPHLIGLVHGVMECEMGKACDLDCEWYQLQQLKAENKKLRFPREDIDFAVLTKEEFENYNKLKAENEELDRKLRIAYTAEAFVKAQKEHTQLDRKINKYKHCLDEIEGIANDDSFPSDFDVYEERDFYFNQLCKIDDILQKIKQAKEGGE